MTDTPSNSDLEELDKIQLEIAAEISDENTAPDTVKHIIPENLPSPPPASELLDPDTNNE